MQYEVPDPIPAEAGLPSADIITYAQFLSAKTRRDLERVASGETPPHGYPWAYTFAPPTT